MTKEIATIIINHFTTKQTRSTTLLCCFTILSLYHFITLSFYHFIIIQAFATYSIQFLIQNSIASSLSAPGWNHTFLIPNSFISSKTGKENFGDKTNIATSIFQS